MKDALELKYKVIDSFKDIGNKAPTILANNAIFVDCSYLNKDLYNIITKLKNVLKDHNMAIFLVMRKKIN